LRWYEACGTDECMYHFRYATDLLMPADCHLLNMPLIRFPAKEIARIVQALQIPSVFRTWGGSAYTAIEAFSMLCARFASTLDLFELSTQYEHGETRISKVVNDLCQWLHNRWGSWLLDFDHHGAMSSDTLSACADAIHRFGAPVWTVFGSVDATIRTCCRPGKFQRCAYNGYYHYHAEKFQGTSLANGMIGQLHGPIEGRWNDNHLLADSGLIAKLEQYGLQRNLQPGDPPHLRYLQVFGDAAFSTTKHIMSLYERATATPKQSEWNKVMSSVREEVKHAFVILLQDWPFLCSWLKMQILQSLTGL
jgi:hypothetical protein